METSSQGITAPAAVYEIAGRRFEVGARGFADAVAEAHAAHKRPRCMCMVESVEMYVARLGDGFIVKRMPDTGRLHAPDCPSYEPPAEFSGLGQVLGSAITEDPTTGETTLKLDFSLTKMPGRSKMPSTADDRDSVAGDGNKLSLRGLLHYLWDQAELTRWHPGFAGKRTWATVRSHLLQAAEHKIAKGDSLRSRLYIPEVFSVDQRHAINARRIAQWTHAPASPGRPQELMLMIAEVKELVPARYGFKAIVKHVPDQAFAIDEQLYRRLGVRFDPQLSIWGASDMLHIVMIATIAPNGFGAPVIVELSLMLVTSQWLPIDNTFEQQLMEMLVRNGRQFSKGLRYNMPSSRLFPSAILTDTCDPPCPLYIVAQGLQADDVAPTSDRPVWVWWTSAGEMPAMPAQRSQIASPYAPRNPLLLRRRGPSSEPADV